jgi:hypothetical protein
MREDKAAFQKHFRQTAQAQLVPQPPQHNEQNNIGGVFERVEWSSGTLVEDSLTRLSQRNMR